MYARLNRVGIGPLVYCQMQQFSLHHEGNSKAIINMLKMAFMVSLCVLTSDLMSMGLQHCASYTLSLKAKSGHLRTNSAIISKSGATNATRGAISLFFY